MLSSKLRSCNQYAFIASSMLILLALLNPAVSCVASERLIVGDLNKAIENAKRLPKTEAAAYAWLAVAEASAILGEKDEHDKALAMCEEVAALVIEQRAAIDLYIELARAQNRNGDKAGFSRTVDQAVSLAKTISNGHERANTLGELTGTCWSLGYSDKGNQLVAQLQETATSVRGSNAEYALHLATLRVLSESKNWSEVYRHTETVQKYDGSHGYAPLAVRAASYATAALASARAGVETEYNKACFRAITHLAPLNNESYGSFARYTLARADIEIGSLDRAWIATNNLANPYHRRRLFHELALAYARAGDVKAARDCLERAGDSPSRTLATFRVVAHSVASVEISLKELKSGNAERVATQAGSAVAIAKMNHPSIRHDSGDREGVEDNVAAILSKSDRSKVDSHRAASLIWLAEAKQDIEAVESVAIRSTHWSKLAKEYWQLEAGSLARDAAKRAKRELMGLWKHVFDQRPDPEWSAGGYYRYDLGIGKKREEAATVRSVADRLLALARVEFECAELVDGMRTLVDLARTMEMIPPSNERQWILIQMSALAQGKQVKTGIAPSLFDNPINKRQEDVVYVRGLRCALANDQVGLSAACKEILTLRRDHKTASKVARLHAELAVMTSRGGDAKTYRHAAAIVLDRISSQNAHYAIALRLAEADLNFGNINAAQKRRKGISRLGWYGSHEKIDALIAIEQATLGLFDEAEKSARLVLNYQLTSDIVTAMARSRARTVAEIQGIRAMCSTQDTDWQTAAKIGVAQQLRDSSNESIVQGTIQQFAQRELFSAVSNRDIKTTRAMIKFGAIADGSNAEGQTPLHHAAQVGDLEFVQILLDSGANPDVVNGKGFNSLHLAAEGNHGDVITLLITQGANVEAGVRQTAALHIACFKGNTEAVKSLLAGGADPNSAGGFAQQPALHIAAMQGHYETVKELLSAGAKRDVKWKVEGSELTALDVAKSKGHSDIEKLLLSNPEP